MEELIDEDGDFDMCSVVDEGASSIEGDSDGVEVRGGTATPIVTPRVPPLQPALAPSETAVEPDVADPLAPPWVPPLEPTSAPSETAVEPGVADPLAPASEALVLHPSSGSAAAAPNAPDDEAQHRAVLKYGSWGVFRLTPKQPEGGAGKSGAGKFGGYQDWGLQIRFAQLDF